MYNIIKFIENHSKGIIALIILISLAFLFPLSRIQFDNDYDNLLPPDPELKALQVETLGDKKTDYPKDFYFMLTSDNIFTVDTLNALENVLSKFREYDALAEPTSALSMVTFKKKGTRLALTKMSSHKEGDWSEAEVEEFKNNLMNDDLMRGLVISEDGKSIYFLFPQKVISDTERLSNEWEEIVSELEPYGKVTIGGSIPLERQLNKYLLRDLQVLLFLSLFVILVIFYFSFRAKRSVVIPFSLTIIALIWTLGTMSLIGYKLTLVNIVTPIMVLILGSSYSIHVLSEYYSTYLREGSQEEKRELLAHALIRINKTIFTACITTMIGFLSMLICELQAFREMGIIVSIGLVYCALLSLVFLPACLYISPNPKMKQLKVFKVGILTMFVRRLTHYVLKHWFLNICIFIVIIFAFFFAKDRIETQTNTMKYFPQEDPIVQDFKDLAVTFGSSTPYYIVLESEEKGYFLQSDVLKNINEFENHLIEEDPDIVHLFSFSQYVAFLNKINTGESEIPSSKGLLLVMSKYLKLLSNQMDDSSMIDRMINEDQNRITIQINYYDSVEMDQPTMESAVRLEKVLNEYKYLLGDDVDIINWSDATYSLHLSQIMDKDQRNSTLLSFILVFIIVCIILKSLLEGFYTILPVLIGVMLNYILMYLFKIPFDLVTTVFASITVGVGVDDAIHFMFRFNNNRRLNKAFSQKQIIEKTLSETGRPIILTSMSIVFGMLVLVFSSYLPIKYFGILLAMALFNTTAATLIFLPSMMLMFDKILNKIKKKA